MTMEKRFYDIVCQGTDLLRLKSGYLQNTIVKKLKTLGFPISTASFNIILHRKTVGFRTLKKAAEGIETLILNELDRRYDADTQTFIEAKTTDWRPIAVPEQPDATPQITFHQDGRVSVKEKTDFITPAKQEVIEVGIRLNSFANYFFSQNEMAYKAHIIGLLQRGVNIKGYLLDPDSNEARLYFDDRARIQTFEKDSIHEIRKVIERFKLISAELSSLHLPGKLEIYQYKHIPYTLFFAVDGELDTGKMMVSPYLYGIRRANCPVWEFSKKDHPSLFRKYWESLRYFTENAVRIV